MDNWWKLSSSEEKEQLNKLYDFGNGIKFRASDIPELAIQINVPAGPIEHHPEKNQLVHTNLVFDKAKELSNDPAIWYAALLHDLGKSYTRKDIWPKQYGHEAIGVPYVEAVSIRLNVPSQWKILAVLVAEHHIKCHRAKELTAKTIKKLYQLFNNDIVAFSSYLTACEADAKGRGGDFHNQNYDQKEYLLQRVKEGFVEKQIAKSILAISGNDIKGLGFNGSQIGNVIKAIKEMVEINPLLNNRDDLIDIARKILV